MARSKIAKTDKAVSKPFVVKPAWPTEESNDNNAEFLQPSQFEIPRDLLLDILGHMPCRFGHKDYLMASKILIHLERMNDDEPSPSDSVSLQRAASHDSTSKSEILLKNPLKRDKTGKIHADLQRIRKTVNKNAWRKAVQLALLSIKFNMVIRELMGKSDFLAVNPHLHEDMTLVRVVFTDYLDRNLEIRTPLPKEEFDSRCQAVEEAIKSMHIRICADFARLRINRRTLFFQEMVDDKVKDIDKAMRKMPLFAWVNQLVITISDAITELRNIGFQFNRTPSVRQPNKLCFHRDVHCEDVFVFNRVDGEQLDSSQLFCKHQLCFGDKLECLSLYLMMQKANSKMTLALVNPSSINIALHMESLFVAMHGAEAIKDRKAIRLIVAGQSFKSPEEEINRLSKCGASSISIFEDVCMAGKWPSADIVQLYAGTSMTGVIDPLEYLVFAERADTAILYNVLEYNKNDLLDARTPNYLRNNLENLKHAFEMPGLQCLFFLAHSIRSAETAQLLQQSVGLCNHKTQSASGLKWVVVPPVENSFKKTDYISLTTNNEGLFISPSKECNGGFIALTERQLAKHEPHVDPLHKGRRVPAEAQPTTNVSNVVQARNRRAQRAHEKKWLTSRELKPRSPSKRRHDDEIAAATGHGLEIIEL